MEIAECAPTRPGHLQFWERDPEASGAPDQCVEFLRLVAAARTGQYVVKS
jgi:hypothetical protein